MNLCLIFPKNIIDSFVKMGVNNCDLYKYQIKFLKKFPGCEKILIDAAKTAFGGEDPTLKDYRFSPRYSAEFKDCLLDALYDLYILINTFLTKGKIKAYQAPDAQWLVPKITLTSADSTIPKKSEADGKPLIIYRGMSKQEHKTSNYNQSWTLDKITAKRFAQDTYQEHAHPKVIIKAKIKLKDVIHIEPNGAEKEVIVETSGLHDIELIP